MSEPSRLLEVADVARVLSVSEEFIRRLIRRKELPAIRLGGRYRIEPADLEAYLVERAQGDEQVVVGRRRRSVEA